MVLLWQPKWKTDYLVWDETAIKNGCYQTPRQRSYIDRIVAIGWDDLCDVYRERGVQCGGGRSGSDVFFPAKNLRNVPREVHHVSKM